MYSNIFCCNHDNDQAGVSPGDIIDEFGGHLLHNAPQGKVNLFYFNHHNIIETF